MAHGPRADFSCKTCATKQRKKGLFVYEDLPVACKRCPVCNHKRGFERLFNSVNVIGGNGRAVGKLIENTLNPSLDRQASQKAGAKKWEGATKEAMERAYQVATPKQREQLAHQGAYKPSIIPAASALGMITPDAKRDSREVLYPALTGRTVRPVY